MHMHVRIYTPPWPAVTPVYPQGVDIISADCAINIAYALANSFTIVSGMNKRVQIRAGAGYQVSVYVALQA